MLKNTHIATSFSLVLLFITFTFFSSFLQGGNFFPIYPFLLLPILAVLPDSDHPESYLNKKFKPLSIISKISGHRTWSHDLFTLLAIAILLYLGFGSLFGYWDYRMGDGPKWLEIIKFFVLSPNFIGIYIALAGHTFGDFLTKGQVKFFYWAEFFDTKFKKNSLLRYTLGLPFFLLTKIQNTLNMLKGNIFPTTGSGFEKNIYASFFNILNFIFLMLFAFYFPVLIALKNSFSALSGDDGLLPSRIFIYILIFFFVSIWYFFSMSMGKLKFYAKIAKNLLFFVIGMLIGLVVIYILFSNSPALEGFAWLGGLIYFILAIVVYRKLINVEFDYFNVIINEIFIILVYLIIGGMAIYSHFQPQVFQKIEKFNLQTMKEEIGNNLEKGKHLIDKQTDKGDEEKKNTKIKKDKKYKNEEEKKEKSLSSFPDRDF